MEAFVNWSKRTITKAEKPSLHSSKLSQKPYLMRLLTVQSRVYWMHQSPARIWQWP